MHDGLAIGSIPMCIIEFMRGSLIKTSVFLCLCFRDGKKTGVIVI